MKKIVAVLLPLLLLISFGYAFDPEEPIESVTARGRVLEVQAGPSDVDFFLESNIVTLEVLSGELKGQIITVEHMITGSFAYDIPVKPGDKVILLVEKYEDVSEITYEVHITEYVRDTYVYGVIGIFVLLLLLIGRKTGLKTLITLTLTILFVIKILLPGILRGYNPVPLTILVAFLTTLVTILLIGGFNHKSYAAIIGILGGVLAAGLITFYIGSKVKLTGLSSEEAGMLMYIPQNIDFDFRGLLFSGIMLGALGAVMDVGMSIASAMEEIKKINPQIMTKDLFVSGMNVGKDIMGTMSNTLILAYTGSAIPLLLLFMAYDASLVRIINLDIIASEIIRAVSGTIGLILTIPLTALSSTLLLKKKREKENKGV